MMERYVHISLADLLEVISNNETDNIYFQEKKNNHQLLNANDYQWKFSELKTYKWFKREVIE